MAHLKVPAIMSLIVMFYTSSMFAQLLPEYSEEWLYKAGIPIEKLLHIPKNGGIQTKRYEFVNEQWLAEGIYAVTYKDSLKMKTGYSNGFNLLTPYYGDKYANLYDGNGRLAEKLCPFKSAIVFSYNNSGRLTECVETTLSGTPVARILKTYDNDTNIAESRFQCWKGNWIDSTRIINSYNALKQIISQTVQNWNSASSAWEDKQQYGYAYDPNKILIALEIKNWTGTSWGNWRRIAYTYNPGGLITGALTEVYSLGNWRNYESLTFEYTQENRLAGTVLQSWSGNAWKNYLKDTFFVSVGKFIQVLSPLPKVEYNNYIPISWIAAGVNNLAVELSSNNRLAVTLVPSIPDTDIGSLLEALPEMYNTQSGKIKVYDVDFPSSYSITDYFFSIRNPATEVTKSGRININHLNIRVNNDGTIGNGLTIDSTQITYDGITMIYSLGFYLAGYSNGVLWANGEFNPSRNYDYVPGNPGLRTDSLLYSLKKNDAPFGPVWQYWRDAVSYGADYYDGFPEGLYDPVDRNNNGKWDPDEDCPGGIGDLSYWCVYNDGVPKSQRRFNDVMPQGIEVRQTVFASGKMNSATDGALFVKYSLVNRNQSVNVFDSVYFSAAADPDIGFSNDDLVGCDSALNCGYAYDLGPDAYFGTNPPALVADLLQGPVAYLPGVTFTDINHNGTFDPGTDIPLDTAWQKNGPIKGQIAIPGAKNLGMTSFTNFMQSHPTHGDPNTRFELRNYQLGGRGKDGVRIDPCLWPFGNGGQLLNCASINPKYMYSGDPVTGLGWLHTNPNDQRMLISSGPFRLERNKPIEIIVAYIVKRGTSGLNSLTLARQADLAVKQIYESNFTDLPSEIRSEGSIFSAREFKLYSNYPNPFNPSTSIGFYLPRTCKVNLKVYDILGREVAVLVNGEMTAGHHNINFNALNIAGGVYFYSLKADGYSETRKMLLLK